MALRPPPANRRTRSVPAVAVLLALLAAPAQAAGGSLEIFPDPLLLGVLIVLFVVLIPPVNALLIRPMLGVLDERRERVEGARARAEEIGKQAERVLDRYQAAVVAARDEAEVGRRHSVDEARDELVKVTTEARATAEQETSRARAGVGEALDEARAELRRQAEELAREAASQVLGRPLS